MQVVGVHIPFRYDKHSILPWGLASHNAATSGLTDGICSARCLYGTEANERLFTADEEVVQQKRGGVLFYVRGCWTGERVIYEGCD